MIRSPEKQYRIYLPYLQRLFRWDNCYAGQSKTHVMSIGFGSLTSSVLSEIKSCNVCMPHVHIGFRKSQHDEAIIHLLLPQASRRDSMKHSSLANWPRLPPGWPPLWLEPTLYVNRRHTYNYIVSGVPLMKQSYAFRFELQTRDTLLALGVYLTGTTHTAGVYEANEHSASNRRPHRG